MIIAVDGPAASGKGTLSKRLASHFGLAHLDTGRTYRAVAKAMRDKGLSFDDQPQAVAIAIAREVDFGALDDPALVAPDIGDGASRVAMIPDLRAVLVDRQRGFAKAAKNGAVLDGRDIGTVVFPNAMLKLFVTASVEERARRRAMEIYGACEGAAYDTLLRSLKMRDARDSSRAASPLHPAADAHVIDTTTLSIDEAFRVVSQLAERAFAS